MIQHRFDPLKSARASVCAASVLIGLAACGNDEPQVPPKVAAASNSNAAATPAQPGADASSSASGTAPSAATPAAPPETIKAKVVEKSQDVLKWLSMSPEKSIKPDTPKVEPKAASPIAAGTITASAPQATTAAPIQSTPQPAASVATVASLAPAPRTGVSTIPVSASANNTFNPVTPPSAAQTSADRVGPPAPNLVASAAPSAASATQAPSPASALKLLNREQPNFPPQAYRAGVTKGHVKVRMTVNTDGSVSNVEVLEATPRGIFEKAVVAAAERWKYAPIIEPQSTIAEFDFHSE